MAKTNKQFLVIGLGNFGFSLTKTLFENGASVVAIDKNMDIINEIEPFCTQAICMDATDERALSKIGINNFVSLGMHVSFPSVRCFFAIHII